jgi:hypothetical protein
VKSGPPLEPLISAGIVSRSRPRGSRPSLAIIWGGGGGDFIVSTFFILGFYFRLPDRLRWDFFRFPVLFIGVYCFVSSYEMWLDISSAALELPFGSFGGDRSDTGGDLNRLHNEFGWSDAKIIKSFLGTGHRCAMAIGSFYLYFAWTGIKDKMHLD